MRKWEDLGGEGDLDVVELVFRNRVWKREAERGGLSEPGESVVLATVAQQRVGLDWISNDFPGFAEVGARDTKPKTCKQRSRQGKMAFNRRTARHGPQTPRK